jgi:hypothetical protein
MTIVYAITREQLDRLKSVHTLLAREIENQNVYRPTIEKAYKDGEIHVAEEILGVYRQKKADDITKYATIINIAKRISNV